MEYYLKATVRRVGDNSEWKIKSLDAEKFNNSRAAVWPKVQDSKPFGSIVVTCISKLANLFWYEILEGRDGHHLENLFLRFYFWTEKPTDWKLGRKYRGNLQIKHW